MAKKLSPKKKKIVKVSKQKVLKHKIRRSRHNPAISPKKDNSWESWQTFNPAAIYEDGKVHLLYRALGDDGISRLGYASSQDGIHISERLRRPAYVCNLSSAGKNRGKKLRGYDSGGSWSGCEDPRITKLGDKIYMLYVAFDGVGLPRLAMTSIKLKDFLAKKWKWAGARLISPPGVIDKSGVLFPEKIGGKFAIMHRIFPDILIDYVDNLDFKNGEYLKGEHSIKVRKDSWDSRKIGAGAPPIKTKHGWLLIYYAVDDRDAGKYKIGAMILALDNPAKVLYRTNQPIMEPIEWYENRGHKAGVVYPCGAVVIDDELFIYYGGADSYVCVASAPLEEFLRNIMKDGISKLKKIR